MVRMSEYMQKGGLTYKWGEDERECTWSDPGRVKILYPCIQFFRERINLMNEFKVG